MIKTSYTKNIKKALKDLDSISSSLGGIIESLIEKNKESYPNLFDYISESKISALEEKNRLLEEQNILYLNLLKEAEQEIEDILGYINGQRR